MPIFNDRLVSEVERLIASDPIVRANTRFGRLALVLAADDSSALRVVVDRGRLVPLQEWGQDDERSAVLISGGADKWRVVLDGLHGGLHRAWRYRLLQFSGDQVRMMTFWKTIWRVSEALQKAARGNV